MLYCFQLILYPPGLLSSLGLLFGVLGWVADTAAAFGLSRALTPMIPNRTEEVVFFLSYFISNVVISSRNVFSCGSISPPRKIFGS